MDKIFSDINDAINRFSSASNEELFSYLDGNDEVLMQIALLNIKELQSLADTKKIVSKLTEHSSETREYCAFLINRLMKTEKYQKYFCGDFILDRFSKAVSDVNPKVCRKIIEILPYFEDLKKLFPLLINNAEIYINNLQEKNKHKNYQYNTLSFRPYWTIFALAYTINDNLLNEYEKELVKLVENISQFKEYTLREKSTLLAQKINSIRNTDKISEILKKCQNDENFFVKELLN